MIHFLDASALVKRYVVEAETAKVEAIFQSGAPLAIARLSLVEVSSALCRRARQGDLDARALMTALGDLSRDAEQLLVVELDANLTATAQILLQRHALRAGDAIQLGAAIALRRLSRMDVRFYGYDARLSAAAAREGILTQAP